MASPTTPRIVLDPAGADRHGEYELLRAQGPAALVDVLGVPAWSINDPDLLKRLLTSPDVSKDARAHWAAFQDSVEDWPLAMWVAVHNMFTAYGSDHRRLRRMIAPALTARRSAALAPVIEEAVTTLLGHLEALPAGQSVDLREHLAYPLPIAIIGHLMGVPDSQRAGLRTLVDGVFDTTLSAAEQTANAGHLYTALDELIAAKREAPGDDMTSLLIATRDEDGDGQALSDAELRDTLLLMISAGYETTVNLIDQAITLLLTHPDQLDHLKTGRASWSDAIEETLRLEPAVKHLPLRFAVQDIPLPDGTVIAQGEAILASYAPANRHPAWHENANAFDITRAAQDHLAFGHGVHYCLGAGLARLEAATALSLLFDRFPDLRLALPAEELTPLGSLISNGHQTLPVLLRPAP
ncbi:cytochrome P450 family protein [Streptomyces sp. 5.8]|uniref:cytochrome P450 family protein n=1 Tax=Streptomyces sp. 5.8 TaxID=3406571 RepID=UPI003BB71DCD